MKRSIYSVRDNVAEMFNHTINEINDATAIRAFTQSFAENPNKNDYSLYRLADWNDGTGQITAIDPVKIYSGFDIKDNVVDLPASVKKQNA